MTPCEPAGSSEDPLGKAAHNRSLHIIENISHHFRGDWIWMIKKLNM